MSESFLHLKNVRKKFGERNVVDDVSLEVAAGEIVAGGVGVAASDSCFASAHRPELILSL